MVSTNAALHVVELLKPTSIQHVFCAAGMTKLAVYRYDRQRCEAKQIKDMQLMAAMAPPGGGRNAFSQRLQVAVLYCSYILPFMPPLALVIIAGYR